MKIKRIACFVCAVCLLTAVAFSVTAVYGNGTDIDIYTDEIIEY